MPTKIIGTNVVGLEQITAFIKAQNPEFDEAIAKAFLTISPKYGVRGDIAICQSIIETGWFKFADGTAVAPDQHNYCGLGVVSRGVKGNSFKTIEDGVTAQIQHLFAYASTDELPKGEVLIDPRFKYVTRGIAPTWEELSGRWSGSSSYGKNIIDLYGRLLSSQVPVKTGTVSLKEFYNYKDANSFLNTLPRNKFIDFHAIGSAYIVIFEN